MTDYRQPFSTKKSENNAWWMPILEKAYAKSQVNYMNLNGGYSQIALRGLTGMPVSPYNTGYQDDFQLIMDSDSKDYIMTASCSQSIYGLVPGHAYTIIGAAELSNGQKLIRLRNPWGKEQYTGPYSDASSDWTEALKAEVDYVNGNDGFFFIKLSDFKSVFPTYNILEWNDNYKTVSIDAQGDIQYQEFDLHNPVQQDVSIVVDWAFSANYPPGCTLPNSGANWNILLRDDIGWVYQFPISNQMSYGNMKMENLVAGDYKVVMYQFGTSKKTHQYQITSYSETEVGFTML